MKAGRSNSIVDSITTQFQLKFKDKINFINKQGVLCSMFSEKQQENNLLKNHYHLSNKLRSKSQMKVNNFQKQQHIENIRQSIYSIPKNNQSQQRGLSLPKLKSSSSSQSTKSSFKATIKADQKLGLANSYFKLGIGTPKIKLQLVR